MDNYFAKNLKYLRQKKGKEQGVMASELGVPQSTLACWESGVRTPKLDQIAKLAQYFNVADEFIFKDLSTLNFDEASLVDIDDNTVRIPVLGTIKAGIPIEAQEDILEYIEIPKSWLRGGRKFYGLKISGDSMFPKYLEDDIVVFEDCRDYDIHTANHKDCAVMVNGYDATFKKVKLTNEGITLIPYNTAGYDIMLYSNKEMAELPIRIIGIAREKRTKV